MNKYRELLSYLSIWLNAAGLRKLRMRIQKNEQWLHYNTILRKNVPSNNRSKNQAAFLSFKEATVSNHWYTESSFKVTTDVWLELLERSLWDNLPRSEMVLRSPEFPTQRSALLLDVNVSKSCTAIQATNSSNTGEKAKSVCLSFSHGLTQHLTHRLLWVVNTCSNATSFVSWK